MGTSSRAPSRRRTGRIHPFVRWLVVGVVAYVIVGALIAVGLLGRNTQASVYALLAAGLVAIAMGGFLFAQGWIWSMRSWREGHGGRAVGIAVAGGIALVIAGGAAAATIILLLTFGLG